MQRALHISGLLAGWVFLFSSERMINIKPVIKLAVIVFSLVSILSCLNKFGSHVTSKRKDPVGLAFCLNSQSFKVERETVNP